MAQLVTEQGDPPIVYPLTEGDNCIGRNDILNDIVIKDPYISRQHAMVKFTNNEYVIHDFNSQSGVFVNGQKVGLKVLKDQDKIKLGNTTLIFYLKNKFKESGEDNPENATDRTAVLKKK
jgi:pSer/pThr/pTyr-binding forkhead associated (FHA) protein